MLSTDSDGPSRVSDDGEVIILHDKDSKELMRQLIQRAF
jgi:predicted RNA polymerase sigma factor